MIAWLKRTIAWAVAGAELEELERWRVGCVEYRRWLAEYPDICDVLENLRRSTAGNEAYYDASGLRDQLRKKKRELPGPFSVDALTVPRTMTPAELEEFKRVWRAAPIVHPAPGLNRWYPARATRVAPPLEEVESATDWDVAVRS